MAGFGKREQVRNEVDLTSGDRLDERLPGDRGYASDLEADAGISVLGKVLKVGLKVKDKAGTTSEAVMHLWCTCTAMIPPAVTAAICTMAGVRGGTMMITCLCVLGVAGIGAMSVFVGARRARRQHETELKRDRQKRTREQRSVPSLSGDRQPQVARRRPKSARRAKPRRVRRRP